ncbi:hypothetical protein Pfo_030410 [Paulownia fortunei]|nr:hypothetical protein Pfo_030410 [Paulownia fortunei]
MFACWRDNIASSTCTFTVKYLIELLEIYHEVNKILITAVSGVAFAIMSGGRTTHSRFKIPIDAFDYNVDKLLKNVMKNDEDFGGKVVIFCEDFRQELTVVPRTIIYQTIFCKFGEIIFVAQNEKKIFYQGT